MLPPTRYASSLRDRQKQATRDQIMHAVARKLESGPLEDLSFAEIAAEAEVGERTVYRHFPTKEALLGAFWAWLYNRTGSLLGPWLSHLVIDAGIFFIGYQLVATSLR